jgi:hypothetical protein
LGAISLAATLIFGILPVFVRDQPKVFITPTTPFELFDGSVYRALPIQVWNTGERAAYSVWIEVPNPTGCLLAVAWRLPKGIRLSAQEFKMILFHATYPGGEHTTLLWIHMLAPKSMRSLEVVSVIPNRFAVTPRLVGFTDEYLPDRFTADPRTAPIRLRYGFAAKIPKLQDIAKVYAIGMPACIQETCTFELDRPLGTLMPSGIGRLVPFSKALFVLTPDASTLGPVSIQEYVR